MISCENVDFDEGDLSVKMYIKETSSIIDAPSGRWPSVSADLHRRHSPSSFHDSRKTKVRLRNATGSVEIGSSRRMQGQTPPDVGVGRARLALSTVGTFHSMKY